VGEEEGLKKALQANAMVGGDNASRAIAIGMVLGAYTGIEAVPKVWTESLDDYHYCDDLLNKLPLVKL
jgi:ADP-ribosylglycohydrolase